ncbi:biotin--[acetyl-CoA-carboxylase] ligase [Chitinophagaceae bacterium IBVUCB2]|nr:biotin--[acetyl-CoA-carboxylase] ligase [Chitinophagaceae bacterium IBVUCB2]
MELQSVDSTNNYARQQIHAGLAQHGIAFFAHEQVAGKGQRGKTWLSAKDSNIALSIVINPVELSLLLTQQFQLSACVAVGVYDFFTKYAGDDVKIKWPNDLYWQDRKAGGILIESIIRSQNSEMDSSGGSESQTAFTNKQLVNSGWNWAIIGIGININQTGFPDNLVNPVSLKLITGKKFEPVLLAKELYEILMGKFTELTKNGFESIYSQYLQHLYKRNEIVKLKKDNRVFEARIQTISPAGKLVVTHAIEEEFDFGEVEWVIK